MGMTNETLPRYIVMTSQANMPSSCWGKYGNVAVVELEPGTTERPKMISERARGIARIVSFEGKLNRGKPGGSSAYYQALERASALAKELNGE